MGKFILGDCMDLETGLPSYPDKFFDLAIVDPPYGIGEDGGKQRTRGSDKKNGVKKYWDNTIPSELYFKELRRASKHQIIWGGNYMTDFLPASMGWVIWDKMDYGSDFADFEMAWTSFNRAAKSFRKTRQSNQNHYTRPRIHPTQKPIILYQWLLENYAKPGQLILDTHVGSASSLIACESMGFDYVGFEIDPDYYAAAQNRMSKGIQAVLI